MLSQVQALTGRPGKETDVAVELAPGVRAVTRMTAPKALAGT